MGRPSKYPSRKKLEIVLKALESGSPAEIAREYKVSVHLISSWKRKLLDSADTVFDGSPDKEKKMLEQKIAKLEQLIGQKEIEISLVNNFVDFYKSPDRK